MCCIRLFRALTIMLAHGTAIMAQQQQSLKLLFRNNTNQDPESKIIGGKVVEPPDRYPFYALLWTARANGSLIDWICGGSLVARYVHF